MSSTNPLLNEDILPQIFEFLTLRDRKNARLVCRLWFGACSGEKFTKKEAFFISNVYDYETVRDVLSNSERKILNLKFDHSLIYEDSLFLWRTCGKRIESLHFNRCIFEITIIPKIFELCVNLVEFRLWGTEIRGIEGHRRKVLHPSTASILLPKKKIVRQKLTSLCLDPSDLILKFSDVQCIASAFPRLQILRMMMTVHANNELPDFSMLLQLLTTKLKSIKTIDLCFITASHTTESKFGDLSILKQYDLSNWKRVSMSLDSWLWTDENFRTISSYKFWTRFIIVTEEVLDDITAIARLIEENPQLERLVMGPISGNESDICIFFSALVKSRLKSISVTVQNSSLPLNYASKVDSALETLPINYSVRCLEIDFSDKGTDKFSSLCLKYFRNILYLLAHPGDADVIFKNQTNLKYLTIDLDIETVQLRPSQIVLSVESLEELDIRSSVLDFLSAYRFPNLKFLTIHDFEEITVEDKNRIKFFGVNSRSVRDTEIFIYKFNRISPLIVANAPNVKYLYLTCTLKLKTEAYTVFFKSCLNFPQLRYVSMMLHDFAVETDVKAEIIKYMPLCPSLRTVWFESKNCRIALFFNTITKKYEFSDFYSRYQPINRLGGVHLKDFSFYER